MTSGVIKPLTPKEDNMSSLFVITMLVAGGVAIKLLLDWNARAEETIIRRYYDEDSKNL